VTFLVNPRTLKGLSHNSFSMPKRGMVGMSIVGRRDCDGFYIFPVASSVFNLHKHTNKLCGEMYNKCPNVYAKTCRKIHVKTFRDHLGTMKRVLAALKINPKSIGDLIGNTYI
jgi:hypothetical protein